MTAALTDFTALRRSYLNAVGDIPARFQTLRGYAGPLNIDTAGEVEQDRADLDHWRGVLDAFGDELTSNWSGGWIGGPEARDFYLQVRDEHTAAIARFNRVVTAWVLTGEPEPTYPCPAWCERHEVACIQGAYDIVSHLGAENLIPVDVLVGVETSRQRPLVARLTRDDCYGGYGAGAGAGEPYLQGVHHARPGTREDEASSRIDPDDDLETPGVAHMSTSEPDGTGAIIWVIDRATYRDLVAAEPTLAHPAGSA